MHREDRSNTHALAAAGVVLVDYGLVATGHDRYEIRIATALAIALVLRLSLPVRGWPLSYGNWRESLALTLRVSLWCLAGIVALTLIAVALIRGFGWQFPIVPQNVRHPSEFRSWALGAVVLAPLFEEFVYRGLFHRHLRRRLGKWSCIAIGGMVFWGLHWIYFGHVTFPNHLFAGCLFGWCLERTRSLVAPTLLHALGNLLIGLGEMAYHTWPGAFAAVLGW